MSKLKLQPSASTQRSHPDPPQAKPGIQYENTYRLEPAAPFPHASIRKIINDTLKSHLEDAVYSPELAGQKCKEIADRIRNDVKLKNFPRHKILATVTIIENKCTALSMGSRCIWNDKFDNYADGTYKNNSLYAVGCVYGIYTE